MNEFTEFLRLIILGMILIMFAYVSVRAASWAYFRTKLEYFRKMIQAMKEGE